MILTSENTFPRINTPGCSTSMMNLPFSCAWVSYIFYGNPCFTEPETSRQNRIQNCEPKLLSGKSNKSTALHPLQTRLEWQRAGGGTDGCTIHQKFMSSRWELERPVGRICLICIASPSPWHLRLMLHVGHTWRTGCITQPGPPPLRYARIEPGGAAATAPTEWGSPQNLIPAESRRRRVIGLLSAADRLLTGGIMIELLCSAWDVMRCSLSPPSCAILHRAAARLMLYAICNLLCYAPSAFCALVADMYLI